MTERTDFVIEGDNYNPDTDAPITEIEGVISGKVALGDRLAGGWVVVDCAPSAYDVWGNTNYWFAATRAN